jgi:hypothetical protein
VKRGALVPIAVAIAFTAAGCLGTRSTTTTVTVAMTTKPELGQPGEIVEFGHLKAMTRQGGHFLLRFDPALFLSGTTANKAAAEDGLVKPGEPVPNDNYVVDEGHRLLTYIVPEKAHVTVLTRHGDPASMGATVISVSQLAQIVKGKSALQLSEPLDSGVWIRVDSDTVRAIDQQYQP